MTHHCHQGGAHLVHPNVVAVGAEAVHNDARGARRVERARRPVPRRRYVAGRHRHERLVPSSGQRYLILRLY